VKLNRTSVRSFVSRMRTARAEHEATLQRHCYSLNTFFKRGPPITFNAKSKYKWIYTIKARILLQDQSSECADIFIFRVFSSSTEHNLKTVLLAYLFAVSNRCWQNLWKSFLMLKPFVYTWRCNDSQFLLSFAYKILMHPTKKNRLWKSTTMGLIHP